MTCAGSRKGGCSFRKCKCRRRESTTVCLLSKYFSPPPKTTMKEAKKEKRNKRSAQQQENQRVPAMAASNVSSFCFSFFFSSSFFFLFQFPSFLAWTSRSEKKRRKGMERRGKWTASKSASLVAVRQIYAAICASNNLAGAMKRVPTKFFSGQVAALSRAMPLIPDHKFPRFSPMERARDTFERRERRSSR